MKTIKEQIEKAIATGKKIMSENPALETLHFHFYDFSVADVREAAKTYATSGKVAEYHKWAGRMGFLQFDQPGIYIYIFSVKVKVKEHIVITDAMVNV